MTRDAFSDDDEALAAAFAELPEPELPVELAKRLDAIPARGVVRRFPLRSLRTASVIGWAAAAAIGVFIGTQWAGDETEPVATEDTPAENASAPAANDPSTELGDATEDEDLALAIGSFTEIGEEP